MSQDFLHRGSRSYSRKLDEWLSRYRLPFVWSLSKPIIAFLFIFFFYAFASTVTSPSILETFAAENTPVAATVNREFAATQISDTLYWAAFAMLAGALSVAIVIWCTKRLAEHLRRSAFLSALFFLTAFSAIAAELTLSTPTTMIELPKLLTCGNTPPVPVEAGFLCGRRSIADAGTMLDWGGTDWPEAMIRLKVLLNIALQTAALFVLGAMLILTSASRMSADPEGYQRKLSDTQVMMHLFLAAAVTLSATTLTDILFANWPVRLAGDARAESADLGTIMAAFTFYYAALGSMILALAVFFSRDFAVRPIAVLPTDRESRLGRVWHQAGSFLFRDTILKAMVSASPLLTSFIANPLISEIITVVSASAVSQG